MEGLRPTNPPVEKGGKRGLEILRPTNPPVVKGGKGGLEIFRPTTPPVEKGVNKVLLLKQTNSVILKKLKIKPYKGVDFVLFRIYQVWYLNTIPDRF